MPMYHTFKDYLITTNTHLFDNSLDVVFQNLHPQSNLRDESNIMHQILSATIGRMMTNYVRVPFIYQRYLKFATGLYLDAYAKQYELYRGIEYYTPLIHSKMGENPLISDERFREYIKEHKNECFNRTDMTRNYNLDLIRTNSPNEPQFINGTELPFRYFKYFLFELIKYNGTTFNLDTEEIKVILNKVINKHKIEIYNSDNDYDKSPRFKIKKLLPQIPIHLNNLLDFGDTTSGYNLEINSKKKDLITPNTEFSIVYNIDEYKPDKINTYNNKFVFDDRIRVLPNISEVWFEDNTIELLINFTELYNFTSKLNAPLQFNVDFTLNITSSNINHKNLSFNYEGEESPELFDKENVTYNLIWDLNKYSAEIADLNGEIKSIELDFKISIIDNIFYQDVSMETIAKYNINNKKKIENYFDYIYIPIVPLISSLVTTDNAINDNNNTVFTDNSSLMVDGTSQYFNFFIPKVNVQDYIQNKYLFKFTSKQHFNANLLNYFDCLGER